MLYCIILVDPDFLPRLRKYCSDRGLGSKAFWYLLAAIKNHKGDKAPLLNWLRKENLISDEAYRFLLKKVGSNGDKENKVFS